MKIREFKMNESGLNRFFGPLEAKIMDILWNGMEMTIKEVQLVLDREEIDEFQYSHDRHESISGKRDSSKKGGRESFCL